MLTCLPTTFQSYTVRSRITTSLGRRKVCGQLVTWCVPVLAAFRPTSIRISVKSVETVDEMYRRKSLTLQKAPVITDTVCIELTPVSTLVWI